MTLPAESRIRIAQPQLGSQEIEAVTRVINSGMLASGPEVKAFEKEFSAYVGSRYACAVNNGTSALSLALSSIGIKPGDEVITTPMTFVATANAIISCGAVPVFADIDEATFNLCPESTKSRITEKTVAIMPVHLYGLAANMPAFRKLADEHGLHLIGDAAQAHGAAIGDQNVGTLADIECFSFYPTKNMTTGEGGMVTTNDAHLHGMLDSVRNHGRPDASLGKYDHVRFGLNLRMTDLGAAIGREQLKRVRKFNTRRAANANTFNTKFMDVQGLITPQVPDGYTHAWHQYTLRCKDRAGLKETLEALNIETRMYYPTLVKDYPHLKAFASSCPVAERVVDEVISLPVHPGLTADDVARIVAGVQAWEQNMKR